MQILSNTGFRPVPANQSRGRAVSHAFRFLSEAINGFIARRGDRIYRDAARIARRAGYERDAAGRWRLKGVRGVD